MIYNVTFAGDDVYPSQTLAPSTISSPMMDSTTRLGLEDLFDFTLHSPWKEIQPSSVVEIQSSLLKIQSSQVSERNLNSLTYLLTYLNVYFTKHVVKNYT